MSFIRTRAAQLLSRKILRAEPLSGGDLTSVKRLFTADGDTVIAKETVFAQAEANMLQTLGAAGAPVPQVLGVDDNLLLMSDLPAGGRLSRSWVHLAEILDHVHGRLGESYGWDHDHALGIVKIVNSRSPDWPGFWAANRLRCHIPFIDPHLGERVAVLADRLSALLPARPPASLLHGDLWGGNILVSNDHVTALIDPACYHGDREVDFAMLSLFDRPPAVFFEACGLASGWEERQAVYRLWPLLVHLRLFGNRFRQAVLETLHACGG